MERKECERLQIVNYVFQFALDGLHKNDFVSQPERRSSLRKVSAASYVLYMMFQELLAIGRS